MTLQNQVVGHGSQIREPACRRRLGDSAGCPAALTTRSDLRCCSDGGRRESGSRAEILCRSTCEWSMYARRGSRQLVGSCTQVQADHRSRVVDSTCGIKIGADE